MHSDDDDAPRWKELNAPKLKIERSRLKKHKAHAAKMTALRNYTCDTRTFIPKVIQDKKLLLQKVDKEETYLEKVMMAPDLVSKDILKKPLPRDVIRVIVGFCADNSKKFIQEFVDFGRLNYVVRTGIPINGGDLDVLFEWYNRHQRTGKSAGSINFEHAKAPPDPLPPKRLLKMSKRLRTKPYQYQRNTVDWMVRLEKSVSKGEQFDARDSSGASQWIIRKKARGGVYFDASHRRILLIKPEHEERGFKMSTQGGILADVMGLGKTLSALALLLSNLAPNVSIRERVNEPEIEHGYRCRATLIICPSHLVAQWSDEIAKHTRPRLKTHIITTMSQHKKLTYKTVLEAKVIIVSYQFLENKQYKRLLFLYDKSERYSRAADKAHRDDIIWRRWVQFQRGSEDPLSEHSPILKHFLWHRLIIDEGHEYAKMREKRTDGRIPTYLLGNTMELIHAFEATYRWYITGTPFPSGDESLRGAMTYLNWKIDGNFVADMPHLLHKAATQDAKKKWIFDTIFCRNQGIDQRRI